MSMTDVNDRYVGHGGIGGSAGGFQVVVVAVMPCQGAGAIDSVCRQGQKVKGQSHHT
jgi:hypothetical protein